MWERWIPSGALGVFGESEEEQMLKSEKLILFCRHFLGFNIESPVFWEHLQAQANLDAG